MQTWLATIQGKVAGLRTQTIVGASSALILLVSKYGFGDVLTAQSSVLDPQLNARLRGTVRLHISYDNGRGVLRTILRVCGQRNWQLTELDADDGNIDRDQVGVTMTLSGNKINSAAHVLSNLDGVSAVLSGDDETD